MDPLGVIGHIPVVNVDPAGAEDVAHGRAVAAGDADAPGTVAIASDGHLLAMGERQDGRVRPRVVLA
jgi:glucose/arabinose dehydrogenase